jgi:HD-like signal output (HDOD) protein
MNAPSDAELSALLGKLNIPPCPAVLKDIAAELRKENCNQQRVAKLIRSDVALASAVLKIVNSAGAGNARKISSINEAIALLGNQQLVNFVVGDFLKRMLSVPKSQGLERFWDRAAHNAKVCSLLAGRLLGTSRETAYCFGLFHDCGIPLMMQRYPDYVNTMRQANQSERSFTATENALHGTDHAIIGYLLTRSWGLADVLCEAIRSHHDYLALDQGADHGISDEACTLIGISLISEFIVGKFLRNQEALEWQQDVVLVTSFFGLSQTDLEDLVDDILFQLQKQDAQRYA